MSFALKEVQKKHPESIVSIRVQNLLERLPSSHTMNRLNCEVEAQQEQLHLALMIVLILAIFPFFIFVSQQPLPGLLIHSHIATSNCSWLAYFHLIKFQMKLASGVKKFRDHPFTQFFKIKSQYGFIFVKSLVKQFNSAQIF